MRMNVNKTRANNQSFGIQNFGSSSIGQLPNSGNFAVFNAHIAIKPRIARTIHNFTAAQQQVKFLSKSDAFQ